MIVTNKCIMIISYIIIILFIIFLIPLGLFPCFFSGFLTYDIITSFSSYFERFIGIYRARHIVVFIIIMIIITIITTGIISCANFLIEDINNINFSIEINRIFSDFKKQLPNNFPSIFPNTAEELKNQIFSWIELNIILIKSMGHTVLHGFITLIIGIIIGTIIACSKYTNEQTNTTYLINQLLQRILNLFRSFHNIVFAQIKISFINTLLTSIMIFVLFPLFDKHLPLGRTLIIITFILGLLPIIGNLISNVIITISALSVSISIGIIMLVYLISIHKLEYFLNAKIIGNKINANPWELILSMIFLESIFGLEGLIAAPIFYAYLKTELRLQKLI